MDNVRNQAGIFVNTQIFREEGNHFNKYGYYCADPENSAGWFDYWMEQKRRCLYGYESGGVKISGDFYHYLNFFPIKKVDLSSIVGKRAKKIIDFPDFWDGDYNYFWIREIAKDGILQLFDISFEEQNRIYLLPKEEKEKILKEYYDKLYMLYNPVIEDLEGGRDLIIGKARRRGFSYKNASIAIKNFFHIPKSYTMFMAYEKKYLYPGQKTVFGKVLDGINFVNINTPWTQPTDNIERQNHIKASYVEYVNGRPAEKGFLSEVEAVTFKDNPDAGRGADTTDIFGEEVGAWGVPGGLKNALAAMRSSTEAGYFKTGLTTLFGTSGAMEDGSIDFADLYNRPRANNFMAFYDIWGEYKEKIEGMFFPKNLNMEGFYDKHGNSDLKGGKLAEEKLRTDLENSGASSIEIRKRMQEESLNSSEAFSMTSINDFPILELEKRREIIIAKKLSEKKAIPVNMWFEKGELKVEPVLDRSVTPIHSFRDIPSNLEGCPVIYEPPMDNPPKGFYKIGYDPYRQSEGTSLGGIIVYKPTYLGSYTKNIIVAEYIGRKRDPEDVDKIAEMFATYYNTTIMHENEVTNVKNYFRKAKKLHLLAQQPDKVISKNVKNSKVARIYGCHMTEGLKDAGEKYVKQLLISVTDYDEFGVPVTFIDNLNSLRLIEELIAYHRKRNCDLVSALFMCVFQIEEDTLGREYGEEKENKKLKDLSDMATDIADMNR
jgi:hypothetical protein